MLKRFSAHLFFLACLTTLNSKAFPETEETVIESGEQAKTASTGPRNWLKNYHLLVQGQQLQSQLIQAHQDILQHHHETYTPLIQKSRDVQEKFYLALGSDESDLPKVIANIETEIEDKLQRLSERIKLANVDDKSTRFAIYDLEEKINIHKENLAALDAQASHIIGLDNQFQERVTLVNDYLSQASETLSSSEKIVSHMFDNHSYRETETQFQQLDHKFRSMTTIQNHLAKTALMPFQENVTLIESNIEKLTDKIKTLQTDLDTLAEALEEKGRFIFNEKQPNKSENEKPDFAIPRRKTKPGLVTKITNFFSSFWSYVFS